MKTVFILGAGASRDAGGPLMNDFLDKAHLLRGRLNNNEIKKAFDNVFGAISNLHNVHFRSPINLSNIEEVFNAIEMAQIIGKLGDIESDKIPEIRKAIIALIVETLEQSILFPLEARRVAPTRTYDLFIQMLLNLKKGNHAHDFSIITFNYDIALDYAMLSADLMPFYELDTVPQCNHLPLLKLHGSLNWFRCIRCNKIMTTTRLSDMNCRAGASNTIMRINRNGLKCSNPACAGTEFEDVPVIVPPSWNKTGYHQAIGIVWRKAAKILSEAENIFVIGYSMPETDSFFKYLFALSSDSKTWLRRFVVYNPDSTEIESRFRKLLGTGINRRFYYRRKEFRHINDDVKTLLNDPLKEPKPD